ncbi:type 1 glutamine amidotransferase domain-containing protein [Marinimicrobium sp. ARAG 43.8]|uniref:type 1 glutamine amidotransferase domain-containing protein n=1 Tax=Marinimicrobium sp. ARAG 43.8 TaxID=3418719 RepID=UPI003CE8ACCF
MNVLMVLTSHSQLGNTGKRTGFWLEEFAAPYYRFVDSGATVTLTSPRGGQPPLDPKSDEPDAQTDDTERFRADDKAQRQLAETVPLDQIKPEDYDAIFYPGGHGPLWDLAEDRDSIRLLEYFYEHDKPMGLVCHAPGVLRHAKQPDGRSLISGKHVTGFSNTEEEAVALTDVVPFLVEDELRHHGGQYSKADDFHAHVVTDRNLVTGQNPSSSAPTADALLKLLR